jgi:2-hydroxy-3-oxopropionate reductase
MTSSPQQLGFIGLGIMGAPMALHLIKAGHALFVHTCSKLHPQIAESPATQCSCAQDVAERAVVIFTMLPDTPDVEAVLSGKDRVAAGLGKGRTVIDMSSISPIETKAFAQKINALGCDCLDAPVCGGEVGAKAASLTIMVGGPETRGPSTPAFASGCTRRT